MMLAFWEASGIFVVLLYNLLGSIGIGTASLEFVISLEFFWKYQNNHDPHFLGMRLTLEARRPVLQVYTHAHTHAVLISVLMFFSLL